MMKDAKIAAILDYQANNFLEFFRNAIFSDIGINHQPQYNQKRELQHEQHP